MLINSQWPEPSRGFKGLAPGDAGVTKSCGSMPSPALLLAAVRAAWHASSCSTAVPKWITASSI